MLNYLKIPLKLSLISRFLLLAIFASLLLSCAGTQKPVTSKEEIYYTSSLKKPIWLEKVPADGATSKYYRGFHKNATFMDIAIERAELEAREKVSAWLKTFLNNQEISIKSNIPIRVMGVTKEASYYQKKKQITDDETTYFIDAWVLIKVEKQKALGTFISDQLYQAEKRGDEATKTYLLKLKEKNGIK